MEEGTWGAIVINAAASQLLDQARSSGNASYNGTSAISVYYAQARQEQATGTYLVPLMQQALGQITGRLSAQSASQ